MRTAPETLTIERLRLAAALTHLVPRAALIVWPDVGPALSVSADPGATPDMSPCHFRRLVADLSGGAAPPGLSWMFPVAGLTFEGQGVRHVGDGVVAVDAPGERRWWWATSLNAGAIPEVLHEEAVAMLEQAQVCADVVAETTVSVYADELLGVRVVAADLGTGGAGNPPVLERFVRQLSRGCLVAEVLHMGRLGCRDPRE